jgi:hypothetical protein
MTIVDYSLIVVLTAYAIGQVLFVLAGKAGPT